MLNLFLLFVFCHFLLLFKKGQTNQLHVCVFCFIEKKHEKDSASWSLSVHYKRNAELNFPGLKRQAAEWIQSEIVRFSFKFYPKEGWDPHQLSLGWRARWPNLKLNTFFYIILLPLNEDFSEDFSLSWEQMLPRCENHCTVQEHF